MASGMSMVENHKLRKLFVYYIIVSTDRYYSPPGTGGFFKICIEMGWLCQIRAVHLMSVVVANFIQNALINIAMSGGCFRVHCNIKFYFFTSLFFLN